MTQDGTKTCPKCGEKQPLDAFSRHAGKKDGRQSCCKSCANEYQQINKARIKEQRRRYYQDNKKRKLEYMREYYGANRERALVYQREYRQANKGYYRHYQSRWEKERYASDPIYALKVRCRCRIRNILRAKGYSKDSTTAEMLGCTWEEFAAHLESQLVDGMSWDNMSEWHIDHIVPLAYARTKEEMVALNHYTNLQPLWAHENLAKGARLDWASEGVAP